MKHKITSFSFIIFLFLMLVINAVMPDKDISFSERRRLEGFPSLTADSLFNDKFFKKLEKYELDQMAFREEFRTVKALTEFYVFNKKDNNDIFIKDDFVFKMEYPYNQRYVHEMSRKMNNIYNTYLKGMKVYYSIIPDKNYFIKDVDRHPSIDYEDMISILNNEVKGMEYVHIFNCLSLEDYYRTDIHWRQESLGRVVDALGKKMHFKKGFNYGLYEKDIYPEFYGSYYGQSALPIKPDVLAYLTNDIIEEAIVDNYVYSGEDRSSQRVYQRERLSGIDAYDVFLSGATPLITIENPKNNSGRELIIFRDSFASSLAPLLISEYSKITLIDLRYISSEMLGELVSFGNQEVLFMFSTSLVNNSNILK